MAVVRVKVVVEVADRTAGAQMFAALEAKGYFVETMGGAPATVAAAAGKP